MIGEAFGLLGAVFFALNSISTKEGFLRGGTPFSAVYISALINFMSVWPIAIFYSDLGRIGVSGSVFLVASGLLGPSLARLMMFKGMEKLGVAGSSPLVAASPLFAAVYATIVRGESFSFILGLGTLLIVVGVVLLSERQWKLSRSGVSLSLGSALAYGFTENFRKMGATSIQSPILSAAIESSVALSAFTIFAATARVAVRPKKDVWLFFLVGGLTTTVALISAFTALSLADVVVVVPLLNTVPFFALFFTKVLRQRKEEITLKIVASALMVVLGSALIVNR